MRKRSHDDVLRRSDILVCSRREAPDLPARWKTDGTSKEERSKQIAGLRRTDKVLGDKVADLVKE